AETRAPQTLESLAQVGHNRHLLRWKRIRERPSMRIVRDGVECNFVRTTIRSGLGTGPSCQLRLVFFPIDHVNEREGNILGMASKAFSCHCTRALRCFRLRGSCA